MGWLLATMNAAAVFTWLAATPGPPAARADKNTARWQAFWYSLTNKWADEVSGLWPRHPRRLPALILGGIAIATIVTGIFLGPISAACGGLATWLLFRELLRSRRQTRLLRFADHFREVLQSIANSLRSGRSMVQALNQALQDLQRIPGREGEWIAEELKQVAAELRLGRPLDAALSGFAERVPLAEVRLFTDAVIMCRVRGGNLVQVLETLIKLNIDRFQVRREVRVQTAEKRLEGLIISVLPLLILIILVVLAPEYMQPLTGTALGRALIGVGLLLVLVAYLVTQRLTQIEL